MTKRNNKIAFIAMTLSIGGMLLSGTVNAKSTGNNLGGTLIVATPSDPASLDPQSTSANITGDDMQGVFQYLFTFGKGYSLIPMLASSYKVSKTGTLYTITLRSHVLFQNGQIMSSKDIVASINRWKTVSPIGQNDAINYGIKVSANGPNVVKISLTKPYSALLSDISWWYGGAAIYPASVCEASGTGSLKSYIGTGPFEFVKWVPGQYIEVKRFPKYSQNNFPSNWYGGRVNGNISTIKYVTVPDEATRVAGLISGQYDVAEALNPASYQQIANTPNVTPEIVKPFGYPLIVFNKAKGVMANVKMRQAFLDSLNMNDLMLAAFGNSQFFTVTPSLYPKQQPQWYTTSGGGAYNHPNISKVHQLLKEAGYKGQSIRWLVSQQFPFLFQAAEAAVPELKAAGLNVHLDVVDWATLTQERTNPNLYDAFFTYNSFSPEPPVGDAWLSPEWPGFWNNNQVQRLAEQLNATGSLVQRKKIWSKIQTLVYQQVPIISLGQFYNFEAVSTKVKGFIPTYSPFFYDVKIN